MHVLTIWNFYFNPRSPHRERHTGQSWCFNHAPISIHAPPTGSDRVELKRKEKARKFQSTLPSQGATIVYNNCDTVAHYFNPRSPHRERHWYVSYYFKQPYFNPRSPHRERLSYIIIAILWHTISIHAPLTGSDSYSLQALRISRHFNPRSPHRERRISHNCAFWIVNFNPRSPHRERRLIVGIQFCNGCISIHAPLTGSDFDFSYPWYNDDISIHAPLTGSDGLTTVSVTDTADFNPRSPHRERQMSRRWDRINNGISIHAPLTGSDFTTACKLKCKYHFNPRSPHRERLSMRHNIQLFEIFQSTLPSQGATLFPLCRSPYFQFQSTLPSQGAT